MSHVMIEINPKLANIHYILADLDNSYYNGFKRNMPSAQLLNSTVHMRKNDELKLSKLLKGDKKKKEKRMCVGLYMAVFWKKYLFLVLFTLRLSFKLRIDFVT